jgi:hypothetical protein
VLHDFVEFTLDGAGMHCNTTMVDMFSIPLELRLDGQSSQTTGTLAAGGRNNIFNGVAAVADFRPLVVGDLRVIAPAHGIDAGLCSPPATTTPTSARSGTPTPPASYASP